MRKTKADYTKSNIAISIFLGLIIFFTLYYSSPTNKVGFALDPIRILIDDESDELPEITTQHISTPIQNLDASPIPTIIPSIAPSSTHIPNLKSPSSLGSAKRFHFFANGQKIAVLEKGKIEYSIGDQLGSSSLSVDSTGLVNSKNSYAAFGTSKQSIGDEKFKFTGKEKDEDTGLYYYGARYYEPLLGRFLEADSVFGSARSPQTLNRYAYVRNNPLILTDPTGNNDAMAGKVTPPKLMNNPNDAKYSPYIDEFSYEYTPNEGEASIGLPPSKYRGDPMTLGVSGSFLDQNGNLVGDPFLDSPLGYVMSDVAFAPIFGFLGSKTGLFLSRASRAGGKAIEEEAIHFTGTLTIAQRNAKLTTLSDRLGLIKKLVKGNDPRQLSEKTAKELGFAFRQGGSDNVLQNEVTGYNVGAISRGSARQMGDQRTYINTLKRLEKALEDEGRILRGEAPLNIPNRNKPMYPPLPKDP